MRSAARRAWPHLRAALILVHVVVVLMFALPNPGTALNRQAWKNPTVQHEMIRWADRLTSLGLPMTHETLEQRLWDGLNRWAKLRRRLLAPLDGYGRYVGIRQPWTMFAAPHRHPAHLEIDLQTGGRWRTLYVSRSAEHAWRRATLDHDRIRAAIFRHTWPQYAGTHQMFAAWVAKQAAEEFPEASHVRVRLYRARTPTPSEVRAGFEPPGTYEREVVIALKGLR